MRLYSRMNASAVDDPEYGHIEPGEDGAFSFEDELSDRLLRFHHKGKPAWETDEQRSARMHDNEMARRRDPESLYSAVAGIADLTKQLAALQLGSVAAPGNGLTLPPEAAAELDALRKQVAELQAAAAPSAGDAPGGEGETPEKPAARRKTAGSGATPAQ